MEVLLVTSSGWPEGEPGHESLDRELLARGVAPRWVVWDDEDVDWAAADLVAVRATWDYVDRWQEFLAWSHDVAGRTTVLNGADVFTWNVDKTYLGRVGDLPGADGLRVLPTTLVTSLADLSTARAAYGDLVVKPRVGAGGVGVVVVRADEDLDRVEKTLLGDGGAPLSDQGLVVQPLVDSVRTTGEVSVFVVDGTVTVQVRKHPGDGEIRVHEHLGGTYAPEPLDDELSALSTAALAAVAGFTGRPLDYGRVDLLHWRDSWHVSELEVIEPSLYLDVLDANAAPFADLVAARLRTV